MKNRLFAALLALAVIFSLAACGSDSPSPAETPAAAEESAAPVEAPAVEAEAESDPEAETVSARIEPEMAVVDTSYNADPITLYSGGGLTVSFNGFFYNESSEIHYPFADFAIANYTGKGINLEFRNIVINGYVDATDMYGYYDTDGDFNPYVPLYQMCYLGYDKIESLSADVHISTVDLSSYITDADLGDFHFDAFTAAYTGENTAPTVPEAPIVFENEDLTIYAYDPVFESAFGTKTITSILVATGSGAKTLDDGLLFHYDNWSDTCRLNGEKCALSYRYDFTLTDQSHYVVMDFSADSFIFDAASIKELESVDDIETWGFGIETSYATTHDSYGLLSYLYTAD